MNAVKMSEAEADKRDADAREDKAKAVVLAYRLDAGDHIQWMSEEETQKDTVVCAYQATPVAGCVMRSMLDSREQAGIVGPLPWSLIVRANDISRGVSKVLDVLHGTLTNGLDSEYFEFLDVAVMSAIAHTLFLADMRETGRSAAAAAAASGVQGVDELRKMSETGLFAATMSGSNIAIAASKMAFAGDSRSDEHPDGRRSMMVPLKPGDDAETIMSAMRSAIFRPSRDRAS